MDDVASRAGVSRAAASKVLHGSRSTTRVAEATRLRILMAAEDLQYTPNGVAQALRSRRMNVIGFYIGDWMLDTRDVFLGAIVAGLQLGCDSHRKDLLIHGSFRGHSTDDIYRELINGKVDGLVMFAQADDQLAARLSESSVPVVSIADAVASLPYVRVDDAAGSRMIARYLAEKGHRRVLYHRGSLVQSSQELRYSSFCEAAHELGITVITYDRPTVDAKCDLTDEEMACLRQEAGERPTAVVSSLDNGAYRALAYCQSIGLEVPRDIAIVGFDGLVPDMMTLRLTTIRAPWTEVSRTALDLMMQRLAGESVPRETVLPVELFIGETG